MELMDRESSKDYNILQHVLFVILFIYKCLRSRLGSQIKLCTYNTRSVGTLDVIMPKVSKDILESHSNTMVIRFGMILITG